MTARARWLGAWCAIATAVTGRHWYLSTGCLHGDHTYCQVEARRYDGTVKVASSCKTCATGCRCRCHRRGRRRAA